MIITDDRKELFKAISAAQGEFTTVAKDKANPFFNSKYAPLDSIIEMVRPVLMKHGLSAMQFTDLAETGQGIIIETIITHETGQYVSGRLFMPAAKSDPQGYGSAITYGRRYALAAALGIVSDEDTDGNGPKGEKAKPKASEEPAKSAPQASTVLPADAEYHGHVRMALLSIYGEDKKAALDKVEELTSFVPKGKTEAERTKGIRDFTKITGKRLEILAHNLEKLVVPAKQEEMPTICAECQQEYQDGACRNFQCPAAKPYED